MFILLLAFSLLLVTPEIVGFNILNVVQHHRLSQLNCPCQNTSLCQPIPRAKGHTKLAYTLVPENWKYYNYSKITELIITYDVATMNPQLICTAHKNNVQLHLMLTFVYETYINITKRDEWIDYHLTLVKENYLDGINIDYEQLRMPFWIPELVNFVSNLSERMKLASPNYQLTYCLNAHSWKDLELEYSSAVRDAVDYFMVMAYDEATDLYVECYATANQSPQSTVKGLDEYLSVGIPATKIVIGMPWYGYLYTCTKLTEDGRCPLPDCNIFEHAPQSNITEIYTDYMTNSSYKYKMGWNETTLSPYITITLSTDTKNEIKQYWYDNGQSLREKSLIYKQYGIRGVGAFHVDATSYTIQGLQEVTKQYWDFFNVFDN